MAKKKKSYRKKRVSKSTSPKHDLPSGFWSQVGALILIVVSILFIVTWFNAGGPVLDWIYKITQTSVGYAVYILPALFTYLAIEIFRSEDNKLPTVMKFATVSAIIWFSALFGLLRSSGGQTTGGFIGDLINKGMLTLVNGTVAAFIYVLLIAITLLFILKVTPDVVIKKIWQLGKRDLSDQEANIKVMRNAAAIDASPSSVIGNLKISSSVPTLDPKEASEIDRKSKLAGSRRDKPGEDQALVTISDPNWEGPSLDLLEKKQSPADAGDIQQNALIIKNTLDEFDIDVEMEGANTGPRVTQFTLKPPSGVKLTRITALETNLALNLAAQSLRIEAPIPGQKAVGIEVPNRKAADVRLFSILDSPEWKNKTEPLSFAIGKDIAGKVMIGELNKMPHLLIAGQTNAGKSVMINTLLTSLLYHNSPSELKLILVDPKQVEMTAYEDIPHLITPVIAGETEKTISALKWAVNEMQRRYPLLAEHKVKDIKSYNQKIQASGEKIAVADEHGILQDHENGAMPYIVIVIDELNDLMTMAGKEVESLIVRLAQKARAVGIHLVLATQSPRVDVITGLIKANIPARIAFTATTQTESRIILDQNGAEKLLGSGDMLYITATMSKPKRIQGAFVTDVEVHKVTDHLRAQSPPQYNDDVVSQPVHLNGKGGIIMDFDDSNDDDLYKDAVRLVIDSGKASASSLQRHLRVGYSRAARIIDSMEEQGIIGPANGAKPREVLVSNLDEFGDNDIYEDL